MVCKKVYLLLPNRKKNGRKRTCHDILIDVILHFPVYIWFKLLSCCNVISLIILCSFPKTLNSCSNIFSGLVYLHVARKAAWPLNHNLSKEFDLQPRLAASPEQPKKDIESLKGNPVCNIHTNLIEIFLRK